MSRSVAWWWVAIACVVLTFDTAASLVSTTTGIPYTAFAIGSYVIYFMAGYLVGRRFGMSAGIAAGAVAGITDATLGWLVSWLLSAASAEGEIGPALVLGTIVIVAAGATVLGAIGALVGRRAASRAAGIGAGS
ncbi:MAG TPA: hypothetical protein VF039_13795 [Longimicrobiales bacterium]